MAPMFSLIVPVYNVQSYIEKCLNSILNQTYSDFEVLLVDDGSTDKSADICHMFCSKDSRFKYFHKQNGGLSDARNFGINHSVGQYLFFVDSDDYIDLELLERVYKHTSTNPDVITIRMTRIDNDNVIENDSGLSEILTSLDTLSKKIEWLISKSENSWSAVRYIVKRELIITKNLFFEKGILHEDIDWSSRMFTVINSMEFDVYQGYYYVISRSGSITNTVNYRRITDKFDTVKRFCMNNDVFDNALNVIIHRELVNSAFRGIKLYSKVPMEDRSKIWKSYKENSKYFDGSDKLSVRLIVCCSKLFGVKFAFKIMDFACRLRGVE